MSYEKVREFHVKNGFPIEFELSTQTDPSASHLLKDLNQRLEPLITELKIRWESAALLGDWRLNRLYLILEEVSELISALRRQDEIDLADAIGDLDYVVKGTSVTYNIPHQEICEEIHRSNMTKKKRSPDNPRMRDKGSKYESPDITGILTRRPETKY